MAVPNIVNVTTIYGRSTGAALTTNLITTQLTCPVNKVLKINSIFVSNVDLLDSVEVTVDFYDSSQTTSFALSSTIIVPSKSTLIVVGKETGIYLEEGDEIRAGASHIDRAEIIISYEELDDA